MDSFVALAAASMGVLIVILAILVALYVLSSIAIMRVLKILGYANAWMAWIPFLNYFALANVTADADGKNKIFGAELPNIVFSFWWVLQIIFNRIPNVGGLLATILQVICLGTCFINIYSRIENKDEKDVQAIAYVSGLIPIIAIVKFLCYDKNLRVGGNQQ